MTRPPADAGDTAPSWPRRRTLRVVALLMLLHVMAGAAIVIVGEAGTSMDFDRYYEIGSTAGRPYVSFQVEHAPLTLGFFRLLASTTGSRRNFGNAMVTVDVAANIAVAVTLGVTFDWVAALVYLAISLPLLAILDTRFDLLPTTAATLAIAAHVRRRPVAAMAALTCGVGFKLWPLCLTVLVIRSQHGVYRRRAIVALVCALAALGLGWLAVGGLRGIMQVLTFRGATGWQVESLVGFVLMCRDFAAVRTESGAFRVGYVAPLASTAMLALAALTALSIGWLGASRARPRIGATWLASVAALLIFSPLLSPQFMVWLAPAAAIAWREGDRTPAILTGIATLMTAIFMSSYGAVMTGQLWALGLVALRNVMLIVIMVVAARAATRSARDDVGDGRHERVADERQ